MIERMAFLCYPPKMNLEYEVFIRGRCCYLDQISARLTKNLLTASLLKNLQN